MRKNGRKWSNISVKKYHHRPGFGVRSGNVKLLKKHIEQSRPDACQKGPLDTHTAPQVRDIQPKPLDMKVEANTMAEKLRANWPTKRSTLLLSRGATNLLFRDAVGPRIQRSIIGGRSNIEGSEVQTRKARTNNASEVFPEIMRKP